MTSRIRVLPSASADMMAISDRLGRERKGLGRRFLTAVRKEVLRLSKTPDLGESFELPNNDVPGLRVLSVAGFRNHLIFYREVAAGIEVIRVRHGAMDIPADFDA